MADHLCKGEKYVQVLNPQCIIKMACMIWLVIYVLGKWILASPIHKVYGVNMADL